MIVRTLINELCTEDSVYVNGIGLFSKQFHSAQVGKNEIQPPHFDVTLDAKAEGSGYGFILAVSKYGLMRIVDADESIKQWVSDLQRDIKAKKQVSFPGFGTFSMKKGELVFSCDRIPQLNVEYEGMDPLVLSEKPARKRKVSAVPVPEPEPVPEEPQPEATFVAVPEPEPVPEEPQPEATFVPVPEPEPMPEEPQPEATFVPIPEPEPMPEEPQPEATFVPVPEPEPVPEEPQSEATFVPVPEPEPMPEEPQPEATLVAAPEPEPMPEEPQPEEEESGDDEKPASLEKKRRRWPIVLLILLILLAAGGGAAYYFRDTLMGYYQQWKGEGKSPEQPGVTVPVEQETDKDTDVYNPVEESDTVVTDTLVEELEPVQEEIPVVAAPADGGLRRIRFESGKFYVIHGSFGSVADCEKHVKIAGFAKYNPAILEVSGDWHLRVCLGVFSSESEAEGLAGQVSKAWVMK